jgi:hypothetical protein
VAAQKPTIVSLETIPVIEQTESMINMRINRLQTKYDARFSARSPHHCNLAHICFEARKVYLKTYKPLFRERQGHQIIYADLEKDAIHFGPDFEMWHLKAFVRSTDATQVRRLILEYGHGVRTAMGHAMLSILKICLLFPKLETLTIVPPYGVRLHEKALDRFSKTNNQSNQKSKWVIRLLKPSRMDGEQRDMLRCLRLRLEQEMRKFREKKPEWNVDWKTPTILLRQSYMVRVSNMG